MQQVNKGAGSVIAHLIQHDRGGDIPNLFFRILRARYETERLHVPKVHFVS